MSEPYAKGDRVEIQPGNVWEKGTVTLVYPFPGPFGEQGHKVLARLDDRDAEPSAWVDEEWDSPWLRHLVE